MLEAKVEVWMLEESNGRQVHTLSTVICVLRLVKSHLSKIHSCGTISTLRLLASLADFSAIDIFRTYAMRLMRWIS